MHYTCYSNTFPSCKQGRARYMYLQFSELLIVELLKLSLMEGWHAYYFSCAFLECYTPAMTWRGAYSIAIVRPSVWNLPIWVNSGGISVLWTHFTSIMFSLCVSVDQFIFNHLDEVLERCFHSYNLNSKDAIYLSRTFYTFPHGKVYNCKHGHQAERYLPPYWSKMFYIILWRQPKHLEPGENTSDH